MRRAPRNIAIPFNVLVSCLAESSSRDQLMGENSTSSSCFMPCLSCRFLPAFLFMFVALALPPLCLPDLTALATN